MNNEDIFAKKIIDILGKDPEVSSEIQEKLYLARMSALKKKKEKFNIGKYLDFSFIDFYKILIPVMSFAFISVFIGLNFDNSDDELVQISSYAEKADMFDMDIDLDMELN